MAAKSRDLTKKQKATLRKAAYLAVAAVILLTLGSILPHTGLPGWRDVFVATGLAPATTTAEGELEVHFIDVGNADCALIRQGTHAALIDAGERGDGEDILAYLKKQGVHRLDLAVATHPHADHIGGMGEVLENIPTKQLLMAFMPETEAPTSQVYLRMLEAVEAGDVALVEAVPGETYAIGEAALQVLGPLKEDDDANAMSVVTRLAFGRRAFLFTGDATTACEQAMMNNIYPLQADVLKVGHHGSDTSNSAAFLQQVSPEFAVIPCGMNNSYGHPMESVLEDLAALEVKVYRADVHGSVVFTTDGTKLTGVSEHEDVF